jgi:hypothetical protein
MTDLNDIFNIIDKLDDKKYIIKPDNFGKGFEVKTSQDKPQEMGQ